MKKDRTPKIVTTAILTLITVLFWAGFEIYHSITAKPAPNVPAEIINPIDPTLDTKSLDDINQRTFLNDSEIGTTQLSTETPSPTQTPNATPTASPVILSSPTAVPTSTP